MGTVELSKSILICKSAIEIQRRLSRGYMGVRGESKRDLTNAPFGDSRLLQITSNEDNCEKGFRISNRKARVEKRTHARDIFSF